MTVWKMKGTHPEYGQFVRFAETKEAAGDWMKEASSRGATFADYQWPVKVNLGSQRSTGVKFLNDLVQEIRWDKLSP